MSLWFSWTLSPAAHLVRVGQLFGSGFCWMKVSWGVLEITMVQEVFQCSVLACRVCALANLTSPAPFILPYWQVLAWTFVISPKVTVALIYVVGYGAPETEAGMMSFSEELELFLHLPSLWIFCFFETMVLVLQVWYMLLRVKVYFYLLCPSVFLRVTR